MKQLLMLGIIITVGSTTIVIGQQARGESPAVQAETRAKVIAELAAVSVTQSVKNSPFSAEEVNESVQTLADGNRIVRSSSGKIYRNSEGRIRREHSGAMGGMMGSFYTTSPAVSIISPAEGHKYVLDTYEKTAKVLELADGQKELVIASKARTAGDTDKAMVAAELRSKIETDVRVREPMVVVEAGGSGMSVRSSAPEAWVATRYETKTEELGTRDFDGIAAEGTRRVTTIPAGAIGNELPIETVYERWFSKELGMVVYSKNSDPRFGEQTYKLTNIVRSEPDQSLFSVPNEYRKILEPTTVYRISEAGPQSRPTVITKGVNAATPVKKTKP